MKITPSANQGFSLVEVTVALGLMAFALVPMIALLPMGMTTNRDSRSSMEAINVASAIVADLRAAEAEPTGPPVSPRFKLDFSRPSTEFSVNETFENAAGDGSVSAITTEKKVVVNFVTQPANGATPGLYEAVVDVAWGLPPGQQAVPEGYKNLVRLYAAIRK